MSENGQVYDGRHKAVLEHPDHKDGVNHGILTVTGIIDLAPSVARIIATLEHEGDPTRWLTTNPAIRLEIPDRAGTTVSRVYTVRDAAIGDIITITFDVVRHEGASPAMDWLAQVRPGTRTRVLGPRPHFCPTFVEGAPVGLFADETAIPALATILRDWPRSHVGQAWLETPDRAVVDDLPRPDGVELHWVRRTDAEPGTTGALPSAAVEFSTNQPGPITVWACGEFNEMRAIRSHFRTDRGLSRAEVEVFGYWRRNLSSSEIDRARLERYDRQLAKDPTRMVILDDFELDE